MQPTILPLGNRKSHFSTMFFIHTSVLWRCWLGGRESILPVKQLSGGMLVWLSVCCEVQTCIWPSWCHCHSLSIASVKSRLVLPFWYRLTWVVPEKGPLNGCVCVCVFFIHSFYIPSHYLRKKLNILYRDLCRWQEDQDQGSKQLPLYHMIQIQHTQSATKQNQ